MVVEVSTFLVTAKLQHLLTRDEFVVVGLKRKLEYALEKIQQLYVFLECSDLSHGNNDNVFKVVTDIYQVEAAIDMYLRTRVHSRQKLFAKASSSLQYLRLKPLWSQMELSKGIKKFMNNVQKIICNPESRTRSDSSLMKDDAQIDSWENIHQSLDTESSMTVKQTEHVRSLVSKLTMKQECDLHALSMVDSGGSGKTEVVRHVYNRAEVKNHFDLRAWVWLSKDSTHRDILVGLILQATMTRSIDLDHKKEEELEEMLFKLLMDKRYLIVLDNYNAFESWHALTIALPDFRNGSRVVITARRTEIPQFVDPLNPPLELYPLTMEESWKLLLKHVSKSIHDGVDKRDDETVSKLKKQVLIKSRGSAVAICLLGGILYNEESSGWEQVIDQIPDSVDSQSTPFNIMSLSFRTLPPILKSCFVCLSVFPKSFEIPVRRLLHLWLAEGFLYVRSLPIGSSMAHEDLADLCLKVLINRKLVEVTRWKLHGNPKTCRMPSIVHECFQPKTVQMRFFSVYPESLQQPTPVESVMPFSSSQRVAHYSGSKDNSRSGSCTNHLYSFFSFDTSVRGTPNTEIGHIFKNPIDTKCFALLKLLDLEGVYKPILPDAMGKMLLLKFLGLRSTVLDSIPSWIGNLPLLETLDLKHTNVTTLPTSIWKSKTLLHLYVEEVRLDGSHGEEVTGSSLSSLQVLVGLLIVNKKAVRNILKRLLNLREVGITCQKESMEAVTEWISQQTHLESLKLTSIDKFGKPSNLAVTSLSTNHRLYNLYLLGKLVNPLPNLLPQCIKKLTLSMSEMKDDPMEVLGELPQLIVLRLFANSYKGKVMTCSNGKFLKLRSLKVWMLQTLEKWTINEGTMPCLQELELRRCEQLTEVSGLEYLTSLKEFYLTNMNVEFVKEMKKRRAERNIHVCVNDWKFGYNQ